MMGIGHVEAQAQRNKADKKYWKQIEKAEKERAKYIRKQNKNREKFYKEAAKRQRKYYKGYRTNGPPPWPKRMAITHVITFILKNIAHFMTPIAVDMYI